MRTGAEEQEKFKKKREIKDEKKRGKRKTPGNT